MSGDAALAQEQELLEALRASRQARAAAVDADRLATQAARDLWPRPRRAAIAVYLREAERRAAAKGRVLPLGTLPWATELDRPQWRHRQIVGGVERLALAADPPTHLGWHLALDGPAAACGWVAVRSEVWTEFLDPLELTIRMTGDAGAVLSELTVRLQPATRGIDRRWVPWRLDLPAGATGRLELETRAPLGIVDRAWLVIGEPVLDLGGRSLPRPRTRRRAVRGAAAPAVALLMPVHDPPVALLDATLRSVLAQTSGDWELCIVDDGSTDPAVVERLREAASNDRRVHLRRHEAAQGISAATNAALALASAPYVATLDHDDLLVPNAVETVGRRLAEDPSIDVLYSDHDLVAADGSTFSAALKPGWSPDLLRAVMYTLHLGVYRRTLVERVGGWRSEFDGAQDHDLVLRLSEATDRIAHVPRVLVHWRAHAGSAALGELAKPLAYDRGRAAVAAHLHRTDSSGSVEALPWPGRTRVRRPRTEPITVLLPKDAPAAPQQAWRAALREGDELLVGASASALPARRIVVVVEVVAVPNDGVDVDELVGHVESGAGAAGGLVVDEAGLVLAGGVAFPQGFPVGLHVGEDAAADDRHPSLTVVSDRMAVRGVVALRAGDLQSSDAVAARLIRSTARLAADGRRVVWSPHARFVAGSDAAAALRRTDVSTVRACELVGRDRFWNPQRRPDLADESYDEQIHESVDA